MNVNTSNSYLYSFCKAVSSNVSHIDTFNLGAIGALVGYSIFSRFDRTELIAKVVAALKRDENRVTLRRGVHLKIEPLLYPEDSHCIALSTQCKSLALKNTQYLLLGSRVYPVVYYKEFPDDVAGLSVFQIKLLCEDLMLQKTMVSSAIFHPIASRSVVRISVQELIIYFESPKNSILCFRQDDDLSEFVSAKLFNLVLRVSDSFRTRVPYKELDTIGFKVKDSSLNKGIPIRVADCVNTYTVNIVSLSPDDTIWIDAQTKIEIQWAAQQELSDELLPELSNELMNGLLALKAPYSGLSKDELPSKFRVPHTAIWRVGEILPLQFIPSSYSAIVLYFEVIKIQKDAKEDYSSAIVTYEDPQLILPEGLEQKQQDQRHLSYYS